MEKLATTRLLSNGRITIPKSIRKRLNLKEGTQFIIVDDADIIILKAITLLGDDEFNKLIKQARKQAKNASLKQKDIQYAIVKARNGGN